jgi:uncharacterized protein
MKFSLNPTSQQNIVKAYSPTQLRVGEKVLTRSCVVKADQLLEDWRPQHLDELTVDDLEPVLAMQPDILLLGSGARQKFPPPALMESVLKRGIGIEVMDTGAACRTYNVLVSEDRNVVAALFIS